MKYRLKVNIDSIILKGSKMNRNYTIAIIGGFFVLALLVAYNPRRTGSENEVASTENFQADATIHYKFLVNTIPIGPNGFVISLPSNDPNDLNDELEELENKGYEIETIVPWTYSLKQEVLQLRKVLVRTSHHDN